MKTKLYRTITLVLAIVMLLGVTPAFAAEGGSDDQRYLSSGDYDNHSSGQISYGSDDNVDLLDIFVEYATRYDSKARLSFADWENHNYNLVPYDANIAANPDNYVPFISYWQYGNRTSAASKTNWSELENGVCYFNTGTGRRLDEEFSIPINIANACDEKTIPGYFDGNQYLQTVLATDYMYTGGFFTTAPNLKTVICLESCVWGDWTHVTARGEIYPAFPKNVIVVTGLVRGEMCIGSSNDYTTRKIFTNRAEFIEAVKPILASAHLTDRAWSLIPSEFGGQSTSWDPLEYEIVSDWARNDLLKAIDTGIYKSSARQTSGNLTRDMRKNAMTATVALWLINTYEAVCRDTGKSTNYPSVIPATFGKNSGGFNAANKAYTLGIINGNGETWTSNKITYKQLSAFTTREQMAAMLTRLAKACGKTLPTGTMPFTDAMSDWAVPEVSACYNAGMIKGTSATTFGAYDNITEEQAVILCYRAYEYLTTH